jgi:hypothetical protein
MANAIYDLYKQALLDASANVDLNDGDVRVILIDAADYTFSQTHDFLDDVPGAARVATSVTMTNTTVTNGIFDADDVTLSLVAGDQSEALLFYIHTGVESTSRLVCYMDTGVTGLPVTPNGGNINLLWNAAGIFQI